MEKNEGREISSNSNKNEKSETYPGQAAHGDAQATPQERELKPPGDAPSSP
jgi:hypothetical protein